MSSDVRTEVLSLLRELRSDHRMSQKEILEAITHLDLKITRLHAEMVELAGEVGRIHLEMQKANAPTKQTPQDVQDLRKDRRRPTRLH